MTTEQQRYKLQQALDGEKSQEQRNMLGQYATPYPLARDIVDYALQLLPPVPVPQMLEPACGTGVFFSALLDVLGAERLDGSAGFEIDPHYYVPSARLWKPRGVDIRQQDFLAEKPFRRFPLLVANPPYSRHHHIPAARKQLLQAATLHETGIRPSGLSGLYCYFLMLSTRWLLPGGLSCWLIPSEFMDVNYGQAVKKFLIEKVDLIRIHRFDEHNLQFSDALVTSSVVVFRNAKPAGGPVTFSFGGSVRQPASEQQVPRKLLDARQKWTPYFDDKPQQSATDGHHSVLGDYFEVKRGIATGCNNFFIVNTETIGRYGLPDEYLTPVLPAPRKMKDDVVRSVNGIPTIDDTLYLFSTSDSIETIADKHPSVLEYIRKGEAEKVNETYICSRHKPWYSCEKRRSAPFVIPYMGRGDNGHRMFRFILNDSDAIATNGYLLLYPKPAYSYLFRNPDFKHTVWKRLNTISNELLASSGRFYGGGLHKLEPRELLAIPVDGLESLFGDCIIWVA